ncbi:MAG: CBS domain-containing protein [Acidobacteriota bacterium]
MNPRTVADLMTTVVFALRPDDSLVAVRDTMYEHHVRHVPVVDAEGDLIGLVSHRDMLGYALIEQEPGSSENQEADLEALTVGDVMIFNVESVEADTDLREAAQVMLEYKYGCLPVVEGNHLIGILTEADFVRAVTRGLTRRP